MILNPLDCESERIHTTDGKMSCLYRKDGGGWIRSACKNMPKG